ncbi:hypothetical protein ThrDRAFT_00513 [Frankia casuarinae]|nr:hypothetical protein CcI6DRAFT_00723 [Frankia sp. CcI6]EYT93763.1 hypothetical protein ThrDRAFT_00513 [Frankia casuarinae]KDA44407.1 hypothetical protein BMG523Draft_00581 [Frankia sp. BMG5.23]OAA26290.1 hypothetical protein AAY23_103264 [Frankia casuarinae]
MGFGRNADKRGSSSGQVGNPAAERHEGEDFDGASMIRCPRCGGSGKVQKK